MNVTKDALRQVRSGHPWVFDGSITKLKPPAGVHATEPAAGDLAVIFDDRNRFAAVGLYDPDSPIRIRVLHSGGPTTIDEAFLAQRITAAATLRLDAFDDAETSGFRLVHGENDGLPGLVIDRYADVVVVKLYTAAWFRYLGVVVGAVSSLISQRPVGLSSVVLRLARSVRSGNNGQILGGPSGGGRSGGGRILGDGAVLFGQLPDAPVVFRENGLRFEADVVHGHKTGFFLDQRDNRQMVRRLSKGLDVLDVFSFSGGFSVSAAAGGAFSVHSVDINPLAIDSTERNMYLNRRIRAVRECHHEATVGDAYRVMEQLVAQRQRFGLVVVDPPSFASSQRQVAGALRAYGELTKLACSLVRPGGLLLQSSCSARVDAISFRQAVIESAHHGGFTLSDVIETGQPTDHPIGFAQGAYLKAVVATVSRRR